MSNSRETIKSLKAKRSGGRHLLKDKMLIADSFANDAILEWFDYSSIMRKSLQTAMKAGEDKKVYCPFEHKRPMSKNELRCTINLLLNRYSALKVEHKLALKDAQEKHSKLIEITDNPNARFDIAMERELAIEMASGWKQYGDDVFDDLVCVQ